MTEKILQLNNERTIFWILVSTLLFCMAFYMYCINATVHNVVARQNLENQSTQLTLAIGQEEFAYIGKVNNVTLSSAYALGFKNVSPKAFISPESNSVSYISNKI